MDHDARLIKIRSYKKKIKKHFSIFLEVGEVRGVSIFCLGTVGKVAVDSWWVEAGYETHRVPSYDLDTLSDALENHTDRRFSCDVLK